MTITKLFSITQWATYAPIETLPENHAVGCEKNVVSTVMNHLPVLVTTWLNGDTGEGYEKRVYTVPEDQQ